MQPAHSSGYLCRGIAIRTDDFGTVLRVVPHRALIHVVVQTDFFRDLNLGRTVSPAQALFFRQDWLIGFQAVIMAKNGMADQ